MDPNEEKARVQEELEHATSGRLVKRPPTAGATAATTGTAEAAKKASITAGADIPGFGRPKPKAAVSNRPKTSMFMPSRKPGPAIARGVGQPVKPVVKTALHTRKAGAAQMLLNKGKRNRLNAMAGSSAAPSAAVQGVRGRANKLGNNKSRMKMIDVSEAQDLAKEQIGRVDEKDTGKKVSGQKRKSEATTEKSARPKKEETNGTTITAVLATTKAPEAPPKTKPNAAAVAAASTTEDSAGALASAALSKYQAQLAGSQQATTTTNNNSNNNNATNSSKTAGAGAGTSAAPASTPKQQDWRHLLKEKSNKLSADDRFRVSGTEIVQRQHVLFGAKATTRLAVMYVALEFFSSDQYSFVFVYNRSSNSLSINSTRHQQH
jgi:hypothetical protein